MMTKKPSVNDVLDWLWRQPGASEIAAIKGIERALRDLAKR